MTVRQALRRAQKIANRTGRPVTVLVSNPWITSRGRRYFLEAGRIVKGGHPDWQGIHVQDLAPLARSWRGLRAIDCEAEVPKSRRLRYPRKQQAMAAIEYGNQNLHDFLESIYANELPHNLDTYEKHRGRRFPTWAAAFADAVPGRGTWDRIWDSPRFAAFREAIEGSADWPGGHIEPPEPVLASRLRQDALSACEFDVDRQLSDLLSQARRGRLGGALEEAPF